MAQNDDEAESSDLIWFDPDSEAQFDLLEETINDEMLIDFEDFGVPTTPEEMKQLAAWIAEAVLNAFHVRRREGRRFAFRQYQLPDPSEPEAP